jgi:hypothetical protein
MPLDANAARDLTLFALRTMAAFDAARPVPRLAAALDAR